MITLHIEMTNAAFEDDPAQEAARILKDAALRISQHGLYADLKIKLKDINGNTVGTLEYSKED